MKKKKIFYILLFLFVTLLIFVMNYRVPFFNKQAGPWSIGYGESKYLLNSYPQSDDFHYPLDSIKKKDPNAIFMADPFFVKEKDTFYLFYEHQSNHKYGAVIGLMTSVDGKKYNYRGTVLEQPFHLSYPQVFKYKGDFYMIPESKNANNVLLYKAKKFPFQWEIEDTLVHNVRYKDPSVFLSDSINILVASDEDLNMHLFVADSLKGKWRKHPEDIVLKGTEARAGGRFFVANNKIYLPVQNCSKGYGSGLSIYEFKVTSDKCKVVKSEKLVMKGLSDSKFYSFGMHQLDLQFINGRYYYVYDGCPIKGNTEKFNWKGTLKLNGYDFLNYIGCF